jgi:hypothetical protein
MWIFAQSFVSVEVVSGTGLAAARALAEDGAAVVENAVETCGRLDGDS